MKRVLVCGGRDFEDRNIVFRTLDALFIPEGEMLPSGIILIHGAARGADTWADEWAVVNWVPVEAYPVTPAQWRRIGKRAGILRNEQMLATGIDVVVAFPGERGTKHMVRIARMAKVPVWMVDASGARVLKD